MPHFQKLHELLKGRNDVLVLSFDLDENFGVVVPFMQQNKYTFPVIPASPPIAALAPGVPRNWLVDGAGVVRFESLGFGGDGAAWIKSAVETLERLPVAK